jgi:hypothetical protein
VKEQGAEPTSPYSEPRQTPYSLGLSFRIYKLEVGLCDEARPLPGLLGSVPDCLTVCLMTLFSATPCWL